MEVWNVETAVGWNCRRLKLQKVENVNGWNCKQVNWQHRLKLHRTKCPNTGCNGDVKVSSKTPSEVSSNPFKVSKKFRAIVKKVAWKKGKITTNFIQIVCFFSTTELLFATLLSHSSNTVEHHWKRIWKFFQWSFSYEYDPQLEGLTIVTLFTLFFLVTLSFPQYQWLRNSTTSLFVNKNCWFEYNHT